MEYATFRPEPDPGGATPVPLQQLMREQGLVHDDVFPDRAPGVPVLDAALCLGVCLAATLVAADRLGLTFAEPRLWLALAALLVLAPLGYAVLSVRGRTLGAWLRGTRYVDPRTLSPSPRWRIGLGLLVTTLTLPAVALLAILVVALAVLSMMSDQEEDVGAAALLVGAAGWFFARAPEGWREQRAHHREREDVMAGVIDADASLRELADLGAPARRRARAAGLTARLPVTGRGGGSVPARRACRG